MLPFFAFVLASLVANKASKAQYFQYLYGSANNLEMITDGHNTNLGGLKGHFMVAPDHFPHTSIFHALRTDIAGSTATGAPYFNMNYNLSEIYNASSFGTEVQELHSVQLADASGYALAGSYVNSSSGAKGIFYQKLSPNGMLLPAIWLGYWASTPTAYWMWGNYADPHVDKITESLRVPGELYILGHVTDIASGSIRTFIIKINQNTGAIIWGNVYAVNWGTAAPERFIPHDIIESPQFNVPNNTYELVIVGEYSSAGTPTDAFVLRANYFTGVISNPIKFYGVASTGEVFTSVKASNNANVDPGMAGYVIGGHLDGLNRDFWFMAIDQPGNVVWSNVFDYNNSGSTFNNDYCYDLIERRNTSGAYEYYLAGHTDRGFFGTEDVVVIKADAMGNGVVPNGQFTYGNLDVERCIRIDQTENPNGGISMFGWAYWPGSPLGGFDYYLVKSYFNGVTACNVNIQKPFQNLGPGHFKDVYSDNSSNFYSYSIFSYEMSTQSEFSICNRRSVAGGSNARMISEVKEEQIQEGINLYPNPLHTGEQELSVSMTSEGNETIRVTISDVLGRTVYMHRFDLNEGSNVVKMQLGNQGLTEGIYHVTISRSTGNETLRLNVAH